MSSNTAPIVNAGADQVITFPSVANLPFTVGDDGLPGPPSSLSSSWSKVSGPGDVVFNFTGPSTASASFSAPGTYVLRLTTSDGDLSGSDDVTVVVNPPAARQEVVPQNIVNPVFPVNQSFDSVPTEVRPPFSPGAGINEIHPVGVEASVAAPGIGTAANVPAFADRK